MKKIDARTLCLQTAVQAKRLGITQSTIAGAVGASQSQVSRILSGHSKRHSELIEIICMYVRSHETSLPTEAIANNDELMSAIAQVWDGSTHHARLLANLIYAAGALTPRIVHPTAKAAKTGADDADSSHPSR